MTWRPTTDFEEEIVSIQPEYDFIYGALSEPQAQPFYPRPQAHIEYAASKRQQARKEQEEYENSGKFNSRLRVISEVQKIAGTKPLGEHATLNDWDSDKDVEKEVVAMMRHFGLGPSVEQPLNDKVTVATYQVQNGIEVARNGPRKVPLLFNDNLFKLKPKASISSSASTSYESAATKLNPCIDESLTETDQSFDSSLCDDSGDFQLQSSPYTTARKDRQTLLLREERLRQYQKLHEETLDDEQLFSTRPSNTTDSFKTASNGNLTVNSLDLSNSSRSTNDFIPSAVWYQNSSNASHRPSSHDRKSSSLNTSSDESSKYSYKSYENNSSYSSSIETPRTGTATSSFLKRFLIPDNGSEETSSPTPALPPPVTYANVAKKLVKPPEPLPKNHIKLSAIPTKQAPMLRFYTPREVYQMKRSKVYAK